MAHFSFRKRSISTSKKIDPLTQIRALQTQRVVFSSITVVWRWIRTHNVLRRPRSIDRCKIFIFSSMMFLKIFFRVLISLHVQMEIRSCSAATYSTPTINFTYYYDMPEPTRAHFNLPRPWPSISFVIVATARSPLSRHRRHRRSPSAVTIPLLPLSTLFPLQLFCHQWLSNDTSHRLNGMSSEYEMLLQSLWKVANRIWYPITVTNWEAPNSNWSTYVTFIVPPKLRINLFH